MTPLATQTAYYAVVAQILPVFLLVLMVGQSRLQPRTSRFDRGFLVAALIPITIVLLGELCALRVLLSGSETQLLRSMTAASASLALGLLIMRFVHSVLSDFDPFAEREDRPPKHFWLLGIVGGFTAFGSFAILSIGV